MAKKKASNKINKHWSFGKIQRLINLHNVVSKSEIGDDSSTQHLQELQKYNRSLVREANWRLAQLKKADKIHYAYEAGVTAAKRYSADKSSRFKPDISDPNLLRRQVIYLQKFLDFRTSTVEGYTEVVENKISQMQYQLALAGTQTNDRNKIEDFLRFLGEETSRDVIKNAGKMESGTLVDLMFGKYENSKAEQIDMMRDYFDRYLQTAEKGSFGLANQERVTYEDLKDFLKGK